MLFSDYIKDYPIESIINPLEFTRKAMELYTLMDWWGVMYGNELQVYVLPPKNRGRWYGKGILESLTQERK